MNPLVTECSPVRRREEGQDGQDDILPEAWVARVAHDLRNCLAVVLSNIDFALEELATESASSSANDALRDARNSALRLQRQFANMVDNARLEAGDACLQAVPLNVGPFLASLVDRYRTRSADLTFTLSVSDRLSGRFDMDLVGRAVENILDNARRYAPRCGRVEVLARSTDFGIEIRIGNDGERIPPETRTILFERPVSSSSKGGRDLGLYFCRLVAEAHGGRIRLEESLALPVIFVIELPAGPRDCVVGEGSEAERPKSAASVVQVAPLDEYRRYYLAERANQALDGQTPAAFGRGEKLAEVIDLEAVRRRRLVGSSHAHGLLNSYKLAEDEQPQQRRTA